jgi:hypothetical protein
MKSKFGESIIGTIIILSLFVSTVAVCSDPVVSDQKIEEILVQTREVSRRISSNGMSYQVLKRCGADAEMLKDIKAYLYRDIKKAQLQNPEANLNIDELFESASNAGNEYYETVKDNPKLCNALFDQAKKYIAQ